MQIHMCIFNNFSYWIGVESWNFSRMEVISEWVISEDNDQGPDSI